MNMMIKILKDPLMVQFNFIGHCVRVGALDQIVLCMVTGFSRKNLPDTVLVIINNEICFTDILDNSIRHIIS